MIVLKNQNQVIGTIDLYELDAHHSRAGVGILVDKAFRAQGYSKQALELVIRYAFDFLNLHQIFAHIAESNTVSLNLFSQLGFESTSKLKSWLKINNKLEDMHILQLFNKEQSL